MPQFLGDLVLGIVSECLNPSRNSAGRWILLISKGQQTGVDTPSSTASCSSAAVPQQVGVNSSNTRYRWSRGLLSASYTFGTTPACPERGRKLSAIAFERVESWK